MSTAPGRALGRARRASIAALIAALAPVLLIASPAAAANTITVDVRYGACFFEGHGAGSGKVIRIEWRDSDGQLKSKHRVTSSPVGNFVTRCEPGEVVESGDVLETQIGTNLANLRQFTVPKLTATVDRVANTVSGKAQTNGLTSLKVGVVSSGGDFAPFDYTLYEAEASFTPNTGVQPYESNGGAPNIMGEDGIYVRWMNARGDEFFRLLTAPMMRIWVRQPFVEFLGNPGQSVAAELQSSVGASRAELEASIDMFGSDFANWADADGDPVRAHATDHVLTTGFASDAADVVIPTIGISINKSTDKVTVDCNITESGHTYVMVWAHSRDFAKFGERAGAQVNSGGGTFLANFGSGQAVNIASGDKVDVYCRYPTGDVVAQTVTVP